MTRHADFAANVNDELTIANAKVISLEAEIYQLRATMARNTIDHVATRDKLLLAERMVGAMYRASHNGSQSRCEDLWTDWCAR